MATSRLSRRRVTADQYDKWLNRKADAHVKRDRKRAFAGVGQSAYMDAIHPAVVAIVAGPPRAEVWGPIAILGGGLKGAFA